MKILFVGPVPPIEGGISQHSFNLVTSLRTLGHAVDVISWKTQYPRILRKSPKLLFSEVDSDVDWKLKWWSPMSWVKTGLRGNRYDQIIIPWVHPFQALSIIIIQTLCGRDKISMLVHNVMPHEYFPFSKFLIRQVLMRSSNLVVHANYLKEQIRALEVKVKIEVIPLPSIIELHQTEPPGGELKLLFLGYLREYKGADIGIAAMKLLRDRKINGSLTIAGEPWGNKNWVQVCEELEVADIVNLELSYIEESRISELLETHHILIAPYRSATQSGIVPLAQAAGRPVVVTDVGGLAEFVTNNVNGIVCEPNSPESLASAIDELWQNYEHFQHNSLSGSTSWQDVCRALVNE